MASSNRAPCPARWRRGCSSAASEAFVDGLVLATLVAAVVSAVAAVIVRVLLPSDRNNPDVAGDVSPEHAITVD